jgi:prepilin-type processing-associated H-X9-DG protein
VPCTFDLFTSRASGTAPRIPEAQSSYRVIVQAAGTKTDISNGTSYTYMIGEKHVNPIQYFTGKDEGDGEAMLIGMDGCISRCTAAPTIRDTPYFSDHLHFGSAHPGGCNMLYCDGSVELVAYSVDPAVHKRAGNWFGPPR